MEISPLRCVLDTNVVIDFDTGGCLDALFALPLVLTVPDIIIADEYLSVDAEHLKALGLQVDSLTGPQVMDIIALGLQHVRPSRYDLAAYVLARDLPAILLTGDGSLHVGQNNRCGLPRHPVAVGPYCEWWHSPRPADGCRSATYARQRQSLAQSGV